jgi:hypothetical protein
MQESIYEALVAFVASEAENLEEEDQTIIPVLEEAVAAINNIMTKEKSLQESVGSKLVYTLHRFLTSLHTSSALREQSAWILARVLSDGMEQFRGLLVAQRHYRGKCTKAYIPAFPLADKLRLRVDVAACVEPMVKLLHGEPREQYPAAWAIVAMANSPDHSERVRELDGLIPLVKMLFSKDQDVRLVSGKALSSLSGSSKNNKAAIRHLFTKLSAKDNIIEQRLRSEPAVKM